MGGGDTWLSRATAAAAVASGAARRGAWGENGTGGWGVGWRHKLERGYKDSKPTSNDGINHNNHFDLIFDR